MCRLKDSSTSECHTRVAITWDFSRKFINNICKDCPLFASRLPSVCAMSFSRTRHLRILRHVGVISPRRFSGRFGGNIMFGAPLPRGYVKLSIKYWWYVP